MHYYLQNIAKRLTPFCSVMESYQDIKYYYSYGMNTQEKDDEIYGNGNSYSAEFWQYDARLGRRWNVDPVVKTHESPYAVFANNPIWFVDYNGADSTVYIYSTPLVNNNGDVIKKALSDAELLKIKDEMQKINEQNGISLKYKIVTREEMKDIRPKKSKTDFDLDVTNQWDGRSVGEYGSSDIKGFYSDIWMNRIKALTALHGIEEGSDDYYFVAGYVAAHEVLHQMISRSENLFKINTTNTEGHNTTGKSNLNTDGTMLLTNIKSGDLINELKKSAAVISNQQMLIKNYFRYYEIENELNKYNILIDRNKLQKEMRSIYYFPLGQH